MYLGTDCWDPIVVVHCDLNNYHIELVLLLINNAIPTYRALLFLCHCTAAVVNYSLIIKEAVINLNGIII